MGSSGVTRNTTSPISCPDSKTSGTFVTSRPSAVMLCNDQLLPTFKSFQRPGAAGHGPPPPLTRTRTSLGLADANSARVTLKLPSSAVHADSCVYEASAMTVTLAFETGSPCIVRTRPLMAPRSWGAGGSAEASGILCERRPSPHHEASAKNQNARGLER